MASVGDELLLPPGVAPPQAPAGTHWTVVNIIASDTGGATVWKLVANSADATDFVQGLSNDLLRGLIAFFHGMGLDQGVGAGKAHNTLSFVGTSSPWKITWTPTDDFLIVGWQPQAGQMLSTNGSYANFAAAINQNGILTDVLLVAPVSSSITAAMGDVQIPIFKGQALYFYSNTAGIAQVFLLPPQPK